MKVRGPWGTPGGLRLDGATAPKACPYFSHPAPPPPARGSGCAARTPCRLRGREAGQSRRGWGAGGEHPPEARRAAGVGEDPPQWELPRPGAGGQGRGGEIKAFRCALAPPPFPGSSGDHSWAAGPARPEPEERSRWGRRQRRARGKERAGGARSAPVPCWGAAPASRRPRPPGCPGPRSGSASAGGVPGSCLSPGAFGPGYRGGACREVVLRGALGGQRAGGKGARRVPMGWFYFFFSPGVYVHGLGWVLRQVVWMRPPC